MMGLTLGLFQEVVAAINDSLVRPPGWQNGLRLTDDRVQVLAEVGQDIIAILFGVGTDAAAQDDGLRL